MACTPPVPLAVFNHANTADLPYDMDWTDWLDGAVLTAATWSVGGEAAGLVTLHDDSIENLDTLTRVWVRGGGVSCGDLYLTVVVTASDGREDSQSYLLHVTAVP